MKSFGIKTVIRTVAVLTLLTLLASLFGCGKKSGGASDPTEVQKIVEEIAVDSVKVDISGYPYTATTWATLYFIRSSNVAKYSFRSVCSLINPQRSPSNPHGLAIESFIVEEQKQVETATR